MAARITGTLSISKMQYTLKTLLAVSAGLSILFASAIYINRSAEPALWTPDLSGTYQSDDISKTYLDPAQTVLSPSWSDGSLNPPLSAKDALRVAKSYRFKHLETIAPKKRTTSHWELNHIALATLSKTEQKWCWIAIFDRQKPTGEFSVTSEFCKFFIDMNGDVFEPTPREE